MKCKYFICSVNSNGRNVTCFFVNCLFMVWIIFQGPKLLQKARPDLVRKFSSLVKDEEVIPNYLYHCNAQDPT